MRRITLILTLLALVACGATAESTSTLGRSALSASSACSRELTWPTTSISVWAPFSSGGSARPPARRTLTRTGPA